MIDNLKEFKIFLVGLIQDELKSLSLDCSVLDVSYENSLRIRITELKRKKTLFKISYNPLWKKDVFITEIIGKYGNGTTSKGAITKEHKIKDQEDFLETVRQIIKNFPQILTVISDSEVMLMKLI